MVGFLPSICSCSGTNGGTGSYTECQKSFLGYGSVGLKVELEPCDCGGAYAEVSYKVGSDWTTAGRLAAGETTKFPIPGFTFGDAGLFAEVAISGDKSSLVVDVHLSACVGGSCNADLPLAAKFIATPLGFPIALVEDFKGVDFTEQCKCAPDCSSESSSPGMGMIIGIAIAAVVVVLLIAGGVGVAMHMKKKKAASAAAGGKAQGGVALTTPSAAPLPDATPVETKV